MEKPPQKTLWIPVAFITLLGAIIRFDHLGFKSLWLDEATIYCVARNDIHGVILQNGLVNSAPPLFALVIHEVLKFGDSEAVLRLLPWFGGVISIPAIYFLVRQFCDEIPSVFAALLVAVAPTQVQYSQDLREYTLAFAMAAIMLALFTRQMRLPNPLNCFLMTFSFVAGISLQYGLALLVLALNIVFVIELFRSRREVKQQLTFWIISQVAGLVAVVSVYLFGLRQQMKVGFGAGAGSNYLAGAYWDHSLHSLLILALQTTYRFLFFAFPGDLYPLLFLVGLVQVIRSREQWLPLLLLLIPFGITFLTALARLYPYLAGRQDIFLLPMMFVLAATGFGFFCQLASKCSIGVIIAVLLCITGYKIAFHYQRQDSDEDMRPVTTTLAARCKPGDTIYVYYGAHDAFSYYWRKQTQAPVFGGNHRLETQKYGEEMEAVLRQKSGPLWMVFSHYDTNEMNLIVQQAAKHGPVDCVANPNGACLYLSP